jgi:hypothetical protein
VLFTYAKLSYSKKQLENLIVETDESPEPKCWRVGPGESLDGRFEMKLPFHAHEGNDDFWTRQRLLPSVFRYEGGYTGDPGMFSGPDEERRVTLSELTTVWFAIQYSLVGKNGLPQGKKAYRELWRRSVIDQAIRGEKRGVNPFLIEPLAERLVISKPIQVRIPLAAECVLYYQEPAVRPSPKDDQSASNP